MSRRSRNRSRPRDVGTPITSSLRVVPYSPTLTFRPPRQLLRLYEDRRTWHPEAIRPAKSFQGPTRLTIKPAVPLKGRRLALYPPAGISFAAPRRVLVCVRRHIRREVLHALRKTGRSGQKPPRQTLWSSVHC